MNPRHEAQRLLVRATRTVELEYLLFLPRGYQDRRGKRWPLILFLHGSGERGRRVWRVAKHGPPKLVAELPDFPFVVVSPLCPAGQTWSNDVLLALLERILAERRVDPSRVYLTGLSMGGYGAWGLGLGYPERFAAVAPVCGGGSLLPILLVHPRRVRALRSLPVWAFHGGKDSVVGVGESERLIEALRRSGARDVRLTVYPEAEHDSWTETYRTPQLYAWFLEHRRLRKRRRT
ncbi:MAG: phospholipase [Verrucomicrobia bacterium]|nr:phospholipase [Verrucomicrobiota bacterium]